MTTYVVHEGYITSQTDGDRHFITFERLIRLYKLGPQHKFVKGPSSLRQLLHWEDPPNAVHLHPRYDGNYTLPE